MCSLLTSCSSNKDSELPSSEVQPISEETLQEISQPSEEIIPLIYGYYKRENKYPESPEVLIAYYKSITTNSVLDLDEYKFLKFNLTPTNTMEITWEQSSAPFSQGTLIITPELFVDPIDGADKKEDESN